MEGYIIPNYLGVFTVTPTNKERPSLLHMAVPHPHPRARAQTF